MPWRIQEDPQAANEKDGDQIGVFTDKLKVDGDGGDPKALATKIRSEVIQSKIRNLKSQFMGNESIGIKTGWLFEADSDLFDNPMSIPNQYS